MNMDKVFDPEKIVVTPDHFQPAKDIKSAELHKRLDVWAKRHNIKHYYRLGRAGVCHALLPEQGHVLPGTVIVGADSHTCTYGAFAAFSTGIGSTDLAAAIATGNLWFKVPPSIKLVLNGSLGPGVYSKDVIIAVITRIGTDGALYKAMEFTGPALAKMSMEARMTMTNMAIEAGGKSGIMAFDSATEQYLAEHAKENAEYTLYQSDSNAEYEAVEEFDCSAIEPMVAGIHRKLHKRPNRRPQNRRQNPQGQNRRDSHHSRPRNTRNLEAGQGRRPVRHLLRSGLRHRRSHLRRVPGRIYGRPG